MGTLRKAGKLLQITGYVVALLIASVFAIATMMKAVFNGENGIISIDGTSALVISGLFVFGFTLLFIGWILEVLGKRKIAKRCVKGSFISRVVDTVTNILVATSYIITWAGAIFVCAFASHNAVIEIDEEQIVSYSLYVTCVLVWYFFMAMMVAINSIMKISAISREEEARELAEATEEPEETTEEPAESKAETAEEHEETEAEATEELEENK